MEPSDLQSYFGETSGTGYLLLYTAFDFDHSEVVRSLMPPSWVAPAMVKEYTNTPTPSTPTRDPFLQSLPSVQSTASTDNLTTPKHTKSPPKAQTSISDESMAINNLNANLFAPDTPVPVAPSTGSQRKSSWNWFSSQKKNQR